MKHKLLENILIQKASQELVWCLPKIFESKKTARGININMDETSFKEIIEILHAYEMDLKDREIVLENPNMLDLTVSDDQLRLKA